MTDAHKTVEVTGLGTVEIFIEIFPEEDSPVDFFENPADSRHVIDGIERGNEWVWCWVKVKAIALNVPDVEGSDTLGACSYKDEQDFIACGYYRDMEASAIANLTTELSRLKAQLSTVEI